MGYRGKVVEQEQARTLRASGLTLQNIATRLGVSKSSVSLWVRDVPFVASKRRYGPRVRPNRLMQARLDQIESLNAKGLSRLGQIDEQAYLAAGAALYAGEGAKTEGTVTFSNSDPLMVAFFCRWLRHFFEIDESRLRLRLYLHTDQDLAVANAHWAEVTGIPESQFYKPYRAKPDASIRRNKHPRGCVGVSYACSRTHREIMGLVRALLSSACLSGVAQ